MTTFKQLQLTDYQLSSLYRALIGELNTRHREIIFKLHQFDKEGKDSALTIIDLWRLLFHVRDMSPFGHKDYSAVMDLEEILAAALKQEEVALSSNPFKTVHVPLKDLRLFAPGVAQTSQGTILCFGALATDLSHESYGEEMSLYLNIQKHMFWTLYGESIDGIVANHPITEESKEEVFLTFYGEVMQVPGQDRPSLRVHDYKLHLLAAS